MTREEAIKILDVNNTSAKELERIKNYKGFNGREAIFMALKDACLMAVAALREQEERENLKPLVLDELRKMDGEPVWVSVSKNWRESGVSEGWCIVRFHSVDDRVRVYIYDTRHGARFFAQQDYGISWLAYRQKPKGE